MEIIRKNKSVGFCSCEAKGFGLAGVARFVSVACFTVMLVVFGVQESPAKDSKRQQYSKDYRPYPPGSPEAVVTAFIELADLGKDADRQDDSRYHLYWPLTELRTVSDDCQRLLIRSYRIDGKETMPSGDVVVRLTMDVRAFILAAGSDVDSYDYNYCNWRDRVVNVYDYKTGRVARMNLANTKTFVSKVFGDNQTTSDILAKKSAVYAIPKEMRQWTFEVRLVKKNGKWLISNDSIPLHTVYLDEEIRIHRKMVEEWNRRKEICEGKRAPDKNFDLREYRTEKCNQSVNRLTKDSKKLQMLESAKED